MNNYGLVSVSTFLGDSIAYRNLCPVDERMPRFEDVAAEVGVPVDRIPRKTEPAYARVMAYLLQYARSLTADQTPIERLLYVGDTRMNDGTAFQNLCRAGGWSGMAFIGAETRASASFEILHQPMGSLYLANRWARLEDFDRYCADQGFAIDANTAVVLDLDKTTLGARGRNDHVINEARLAAVEETVADLLGEAFDAEAFRVAYDMINQTELHPFTTDNQDYIAYLCLMVGSGLFSLSDLIDKVRNGTLTNFNQFMVAVDARSADLSPHLSHLHDEIYARVREGDPTPFKVFRRNEYLTTVRRMGHLALDMDAPSLLAREIVITQEVREIALLWQQQGALLFGLSDKPDEASIPAEPLAKQGYQPIHRVRTHAVGAGAPEA